MLPRLSLDKWDSKHLDARITPRLMCVYLTKVPDLDIGGARPRLHVGVTKVPACLRQNWVMLLSQTFDLRLYLG